jgi:hypothetical protein
MILIAALAVALFWDRGRILDPARWIADPGARPGNLFWRLAMGATNLLEFSTPLLTVMSVTVLGLRLRNPRPPLPELACQPGTTACAVASLIMVPACGSILVSHLVALGAPGAAWRRTVADLRPEYLGGLATTIGLAISLYWFVMMVKNRWRPEPGWIDRLGRLLGLGWILMVFGSIVLRVLYIARMR